MQWRQRIYSGAGGVTDVEEFAAYSCSLSPSSCYCSCNKAHLSLINNRGAKTQTAAAEHPTAERIENCCLSLFTPYWSLWKIHAVVLSTARRITNDSCYVCTQLPHGVGAAIPVTPLPLNISETLGVMVAFTLGVSLKDSTVKDMAKSINMCKQQHHQLRGFNC